MQEPKTPEQQLELLRQCAKDQLNTLLRGCHNIHDSNISFTEVDVFVDAIIGAAVLEAALIQRDATRRP